jgi:hypothetical protein
MYGRFSTSVGMLEEEVDVSVGVGWLSLYQTADEEDGGYA